MTGRWWPRCACVTPVVSRRGRVMLRLDGETVDTGDIVAVNEGESGNGLRSAPLRSRDRLAHVEAKHDSLLARSFFNTTPKFLTLRKDD